MPEITNVATGDTIASEWGNKIRSRTIQRYTNVADRTTKHPSPDQGDLSYLADTARIEVFGPSGWIHAASTFAVGTTQIQDDAVTTPKILDGAVSGVKAAANFIQSFEVDNSTEVASVALTSSFANVASVNLSIPAGWSSWKCFASASYVSTHGSSTNAYESVLRIDGIDQQVKVLTNQFQFHKVDAGIVGRRTGMTTTGTRAVSLRARQTAGTVFIDDVALYARATRTS